MSRSTNSSTTQQNKSLDEYAGTTPKSKRQAGCKNSATQDAYEVCWLIQNKLRAQLISLKRKLMTARTDGQNSLDWSTPAAVRKSLRWSLHVRGQFISTGKLMLSMCNRMSVLVNRSCNFMCAGSASNLQRGERHDPEIITSVAKKINTTLCTPDEFFSLKELHDDYNSLLKECDLLWVNAQLILNSLPGYKDIKNKLPINGRAAYSMLMVLASGRADTTMPKYNIFLGWAHDHNIDNVISNIKCMCRAIGRGVEHHGKPPSLSDGRKILKTVHFTLHDKTKPWLPRQASKPERRSTLAWRHERLIYAHTFCGDFDSSRISPSFCKLIHMATPEQKADWYKWHRIAHKVMKISEPLEPQLKLDQSQGTPHIYANSRSDGNRIGNQTPTILTGPVEHLRGDDYYAPAVWVETSVKYSSEYIHSRTIEECVPRTVHGYVLMRKGWPDVVHTTSLEPDNETGRNLTVTEKLDAASSSHFRRLKEEAELKLTQNQRIARLLKRVRKLFVNFTRQASYNSGNCQAGTEAFIASLQLKTVVSDVMENRAAEVEPRDLARCWRKAKYIQLERFSNVVSTLERIQAEKIATAYQAARFFFPLETDMPGEHSQETVEQYTASQGWFQAGTAAPISSVPEVEQAPFPDDLLSTEAVGQASTVSASY